MVALLVLLLTIAAVGCSDTPDDSGSRDGGADRLDAAASDSGRADAGTDDGGPPPSDGGTPTDAGGRDAGSVDAGPADAGGRDAGVTGPRPTEVVAGEAHTCALYDTGRVACWGQNDDGQLGVGHRTPSRTPLWVDITDVEDITAGGGHTCTVKADGTAWCWGRAQSGQLGHRFSATVRRSTTPVTVDGLPEDDPVVTIDAGGRHTCAVTEGGQALCWGSDVQGQCGDGNPNSATLPPTPLTDLVGLTRIASGGTHTCAVASTFTYCWGYTLYGQVGGFSGTRETAPLLRDDIPGVAHLSMGEIHSCALSSLGPVCWGSNSRGQLGTSLTAIGSSSRTPRNIEFPLGRTVVQVEAGSLHTCGRTLENELFCWGANENGELGDGGSDDQPTPVPVDGISARDIGLGERHSCAIRTDGAISCWGANELGQLGNGDPSGLTRRTPQLVRPPPAE